MSATRQYSTLFTCLHDEPSPVGTIGRGAHYSVFRAVERRDALRRLTASPLVHDFAVIWDEDHDERIIDAVERIYMADLLFPAQFIGERKGSLTVLVDVAFALEDGFIDYKRKIAAIADGLDDPWGSAVGFIDRSPAALNPVVSEHIIQDRDDRTRVYLQAIDALWNLGSRPFAPKTSRSAPACASGGLDF
jgi:hypothetical protein